ncbi:hypothetical protein F4778DRAFT_775537 [Xylariomycetidae sp. FL2044]|nr:hypothetical protein F4778DRAFT_775537 [Xylariomycetidae sp. FL2044]
MPGSRLLALPPELRIMIYELFFTGSRAVFRFPSRVRDKKINFHERTRAKGFTIYGHSSILRTCKQCHTEAQPVFCFRGCPGLDMIHHYVLELAEFFPALERCELETWREYQFVSTDASFSKERCVERLRGTPMGNPRRLLRHLRLKYFYGVDFVIKVPLVRYCKLSSPNSERFCWMLYINLRNGRQLALVDETGGYSKERNKRPFTNRGQYAKLQHCSKTMKEMLDQDEETYERLLTSK